MAAQFNMKGDKKGDVHEYIFWHNADPIDAPRRNLYAVRWKDWRLIKYPDSWRLFDLRKDPKETKDLADKLPKVVANMCERYDAFVGKGVGQCRSANPRRTSLRGAAPPSKIPFPPPSDAMAKRPS